MLKNEIIKKLDTYNWAKTLNHLQVVAEKSLSKREFRRFLITQAQDTELCDGTDCLLINGHVFDWKEFNYKGKEIVSAFLEYFTDEQLKLINNNL